jgi:hypothetical protein
MRLSFRRKDGKLMTVDERNLDDIFDAAWAAVDPNVKQRAIEAIREAFDPAGLAEVKAAVEQHGHHDWVSHPPFTPEFDPDDEYSFPVSWHHSVGMGIRNLLRQAGLTDDMLPKHAMDAYYGEGMGVQNWDDYYIQAVEAAAGAR